ncbi:Integrin-linked protein kinase [Chelonia mydas]|uniref:Scaffold protein ILK n=1 Tax=Chelonia mydas TaxID=8469 RepID=M7AX13_CHEMY|nr:Integrin-linked protein kinase [Chelonia mydas]
MVRLPGTRLSPKAAPTGLEQKNSGARMDDIFTQCREGNAVAVRLWLDNTENDLNQGSPQLRLLSLPSQLIQFKADINAVNEHGNTPLHYACFWGHDQVAEDLVSSGALVSISNKYGEMPVGKAKDLVSSGALVSISNKYGEMPVGKAKVPLRELLKVSSPAGKNYRLNGHKSPQVQFWLLHPSPLVLSVSISPERAEKLGQNLTKIPYKDTFWKGTTRTRPRNGTLNKLAGIDFKQLSLGHKLNENQSGELWKGRWQGNDIVIKVMKIRDWTTRKSRDFNEEHPKLRIFSHPNVLPVLGACQSPPAPHPIIITHWMPYGSLYNVLHEGTNFVVDQMQAVKFALDIARGMAFLHTLEPLIPRHNLNSRSIMIDEDMTARISMADVKFSFQCPGRMYAPAWVAPEALQKKPEDINRRSADMWSFAVLLWELVTREVPFADLSNMEIGMKVALEGLRPTIPPGISPHICKLMKICMNEDPAKRPKFDMIVPILEKMQEK